MPLDAATLARLPKLHDTHALWPAFLRACGVRANAGRDISVSQTALAIDAAIAGQGVALASRFIVAADIAAGRLVQVVPQVLRASGDYYLLARRDARSPAAVSAVQGWFLDAARALNEAAEAPQPRPQPA